MNMHSHPKKGNFMEKGISTRFCLKKDNFMLIHIAKGMDIYFLPNKVNLMVIFMMKKNECAFLP